MRAPEKRVVRKKKNFPADREVYPGLGPNKGKIYTPAQPRTNAFQVPNFNPRDNKPNDIRMRALAALGRTRDLSKRAIENKEESPYTKSRKKRFV